MVTTIRVTNLTEAETAIKMLEAYLSAFGETPVVEEKAPVKKTRKPRAKKEEPEVEKKEEPKVEEEPNEIDLTAIAKDAVSKAGRDKVKELIAQFGTGKISSVPVEKHAELAEALKAL